MRKHFLEELENLKKSILAMGDIAINSVNIAVLSLVQRDEKKAREVINGDDKLDEMEMKIEKDCISLIALQQPIAEDLRIIAAGLKIITDLERIGDRAVDIAEIVLEMADRPHVKPLIDIPRMSELAQEMIKDSLIAFAANDVKLAESLGKRDDLVDALNDQVRRELMEIIIEDPRKLADATRLMFVASYLERIADHSTNIGERVIYMVEGRRVKIN
ncbi:MAG: PhoU family transcriptional regulator [Hadesarchaea archaeon YNP_N21]|nr:MAG: PhoU family transcriptional regulator [Hadesarchaea archaeon YNP_N21]